MSIVIIIRIMSEVATTPVVENAEVAPVEIHRVTQRRASAVAREEDRKVIEASLHTFIISRNAGKYAQRMVMKLDDD